MKLSNNILKYMFVIAAVILSVIALPLLLKGVAITTGLIGAALVIAGVFILGVVVATAILSPLWIPFLAGWAAVRFCKNYGRQP